MSATEEEAPHPDLPITRDGYRFVICWALGIALLYATGGCLGARALLHYTADTEALREAFLASSTLDPSLAAVESSVLGARPKVKVGLVLGRISDASFREGTWTADFDVWFRWSDPALDPGETFRVVNGDISQREKVEERADGAERFARYAVKARMQNFVDPGRFPFADDALAIQLEDAGVGARAVSYVADDRPSGLGRFAAPPRQTITRSFVTIKSYADPMVPASAATTAAPVEAPKVRSRFVLAMLRAPSGWPLHLKNFQALFASVAIALLAFFIKPTWGDGRFGLGVGAVFAAIASNAAAVGALPTIDRFTLTAIVNAVGLATIFVTLVASTASLYIVDSLENDRLSRLFDRTSFVVCLLGYVAVNIVLPFAAMPAG